MAELPEGFVEKVWSNFRAAKERIEKLENRVEELERQNRSLKKRWLTCKASNLLLVTVKREIIFKSARYVWA